ncbi:ArdC family protein, partial [Pasteurella oralis]|uniref:ArdC family protein n=1 Tax=Pasteurella oralis TaxID=1071947 RepID=UPI000C7BDD4E
AMTEKGYEQSKWITAKKANALGGHIRKGEKATLIVMYSPIEREKVDSEGNIILDKEGNPRIERFAILKNHYVFNIEQCEGLPNSLYDAITEEKTEIVQYRQFKEIQQIIEGINLNVVETPSNKAFYRPETDTVVMPKMEQFTSEAGYYSTLLHELTHATGHQNRLNREGITSKQAKFGNATYAFEELIAEIGSAFLCARLGFNTIQQNASYIADWIQLLKSDKRAIFKATGQAREACEYMLDSLTVMQQYACKKQLIV